MDTKVKRYMLIDPDMVERLEWLGGMLRLGAIRATTQQGVDFTSTLLCELEHILSMAPEIGEADVGALSEAMLGDRAFGPDHDQEWL